ncbi:MAG: hypothetical protein AB8B69_01595 [Chitinophagales bacterium]
MERTIRIADFLTNRLPLQEAKEVSLQIANDPEWAEEAAFLKDLSVSAVEVKKAALRKQFNNIEVKLQRETSEGMTTLMNKIKDSVKNHIDYSIDQLAGLFAPVPHYQPILAQVQRGGDFEVLKPEKGADCWSDGLFFEFSNGLEEALELSIENNQSDELYSGEIPAHSIYFNPQFSSKDHPPGRYYWKVTSDNETIMGDFFIGKDLTS